jgi:hypothetical protein
MTIGIVIFFVLMFISVASGQGNAKAALSIFGYLVAFVAITVFLIFGSIAAYTLLISHLLGN